MNLRVYDGLCVKVTDCCGDEFEGVCAFSGAECSEHLFGRAEDGLRIQNFLFTESCIRKVDILEAGSGRWGGFSAPFGRIEKMTLEDGIDTVREALFSEEPVHVRRLLLCLEDWIKSGGGTASSRGEAVGAVAELAGAAVYDSVRAEAFRVLDSVRESTGSERGRE